MDTSSLSPVQKHEVLESMLKEMCFWNSPSSSGQKSAQPASSEKIPPARIAACNSSEAWKSAKDPASGKTYYYNQVTRKTQWEKPPALVAQEKKQRREHKQNQKEFFRSMEANIRKSLARGEVIPAIPLASTEKVGPPQEPVTTRVRTISAMNEDLLAAVNGMEFKEAPVAPASKVSVPAKGRPPLPQPRRNSKPRRPPVVPPTSGEIQKGGLMEECKSPLLQGEHLLDEPILNESSALPLDVQSPSLGNQPQPITSSSIPKPVTIHQRRNTGGTIFVKSTMENPDITATIKCVCGVYRAHIVSALSSVADPPSPPEHLDRVDLSLFHNQHPQAEIPSLAEIETFYGKFFERSQMEHDTIIMSLIYVERLIKETNGILTPTSHTWRSILFICMCLASKVWDDLSMWNQDFANVTLSSGMSAYSLRRINQLEAALLTCLKFNVKVQASEYAKYYFLIRTMLSRSGMLEHAQSPLKLDEAKELDIRTPTYDDMKNRGDRCRARSFDMNGCGGPVLQDHACIEQLVSMD